MLRILCVICALEMFQYVVSMNASCSSLWNDGNKLLNMTTGKYLYHPRLAEYDFESCFILKARYNCEHSITSPRASKHSSLNYTYSLHPEGGEICNMREMFNRSGGMLELPKHIREWSHRNENVTHTNVLIVGSSFLRQVFESLVCRFYPLIRDGFLSAGGGPDLSLAGEKRHPSYNNDEIGRLAPMNTMLAGCHSENYQHFFEKGVPQPHTNQPNCSDYIAMAEFPGKLRIYYFFRHFKFVGDVTDLFARIGLNLGEVDVVVTNNKPAENKRLLEVVKGPVVNFWSVLTYFKTRQKADTGKWYGADNVGMDHPPDNHPCMPGIPDDELDLMLLMLTHNLRDIVIA